MSNLVDRWSIRISSQ